MCVPSFDVKMIVMRCCCVLLVTTAAAVMLWLYLRPSLALPSLLLSQIASTVRAARTVSCERERHSPISLLKSGIRHDRNMILQRDNAREDKQGSCDETQAMLWCGQTCSNKYLGIEQNMSSLRSFEWVTRDRNMICQTLILIHAQCWHSVCHELLWTVTLHFILMCHKIT